MIFSSVLLANLNLSEANLTGASLFMADLSGVNLAEALLIGTTMPDGQKLFHDGNETGLEWVDECLDCPTYEEWLASQETSE